MDDEIYKRNIAVIRQRWPGLADTLDQHSIDGFQAFLVEGKQGTVGVNGIQLTSRHNREAEAKLQADSLPDRSLLTIYGSGLGDLPRQLIQRHSLHWLEVKIMNAALFALVIRVTEQQDWLADSKVELSLACDDADIKIPFFANPPELVLADDASLKIMQRLQSEVNDGYVSQHFRSDDPEIVSRLASNKALMAGDLNANVLFGGFKERSAIVVGTGPTLSQNMSLLKELRSEAPSLLVSCDTASKVLIQEGVVPDIVVTMDKNIDLRHLPVEHSEEIKLVYLPMVSPDILSQWRGPRYGAYSASDIYSSLRSELPRAELYSGGSVIHPAVDMAVKAGCKQVYLFGTDFGFPGEVSHSGWDDGTLGPKAKEASSWTINGHGQRIKSNPNFNSYLCELERYIETHPEVRFFNTSQEGAEIRGCEYLVEEENA